MERERDYLEVVKEEKWGEDESFQVFIEGK